MKRVVVVLIGTMLVLFIGLFIKGSKIKVELDKCVDGDTAWFKINNVSKKYRFLSIDTMEIDTEFGLKVSEYVCDLLSKANDIKVEYSKYGEIKDKYNRELVFVYIDHKLLQEQLIENGFAKLKYVYVKHEYLDKLLELESSAKTKKRGIWENYKESYREEYNILENPKKIGCRFIGWEVNNRLYDMTTKLSEKYKLKEKFEC